MNREKGIFYVSNGSNPCTDCKFFYHSLWRALAGESPLCARTMDWYGKEKGLTRHSKPDVTAMTYCAIERGQNGWLDSCGANGIYWSPKYKKDIFRLLEIKETQ